MALKSYPFFLWTAVYFSRAKRALLQRKVVGHASEEVHEAHLPVPPSFGERPQSVADLLPARPSAALLASRDDFRHLTPPVVFLLTEVAQELVCVWVGTAHDVVEPVVPSLHAVVRPSLSVQGPVELVPLRNGELRWSSPPSDDGADVLTLEVSGQLGGLVRELGSHGLVAGWDVARMQKCQCRKAPDL